LDDIIVVFVVVVGIEVASEIVLAWVRNQIDRTKGENFLPMHNTTTTQQTSINQIVFRYKSCISFEI
jgi:hypothetical protein